MKVERTIVLPAPPDAVWLAVADPDRLASWWGERVELDARPGGRVVVDDAGGERWGTVETFEPGRRMVLRLWQRPGPTERLTGTRVELALEEAEGGTRLTVLESPIGDPEPVLPASWLGLGARNARAHARAAVVGRG